MKKNLYQLIAFLGVWGAASSRLPAQDASQLNQLTAQVAQLQSQIDAIRAQIAQMSGQRAESPGAATTVSTPAPAPAAATTGSYMNISFDAVTNIGGSTARDPSSYLQLGDHDPVKRGFSLRNAEISLDGAVDPFLKGFANIVLKLSPENESEIELEETYLQTTSLPMDLQVKAGQFFAAFGRQNPQHPHTWAFVDAPLMLTRAFGGEGLRSIGVQTNWLAPTPFYTEVSLGVFDGEGGTAFNFRNPGEDDGTGTSRVRGRAAVERPLRGPQDLLYVPRISSSFDLTDTQTVVVGASAALGPNSAGTDTRTSIYGADLYWKWKRANANAGFPFVSWQTEVLATHIDAGADPSAATPLPAETIKDSGFYSQILWGFEPRWVVGARVDYVSGNAAADDPNDVFRNRRTRYSSSLTFFPSEFSKFRLQYNHDRGEVFGTERSWWLQMEFMLGAHGAHKF